MNITERNQDIPGVTNNGVFVKVAASSSGVIRKLRVKQVDGTKTGFVYALFSSEAAASNLVSSPLELAADAHKYQVTPYLSVATAKDEYQGTWPNDGIHNLKVAYSSQAARGKDAVPGQANLSAKMSALWLYILPTGSGNFNVSLAIETPC